ncbi:hypothetical protein V6U81_02520 [Micromonospora sp. CPCC 205711]|uniref:hypothetical protein n=1 Tax=Micromonospora sp. CPCC 205547 TaxID=3122400 RepID=UPI002FEF99C3
MRTAKLGDLKVTRIGLATSSCATSAGTGRRPAMTLQPTTTRCQPGLRRITTRSGPGSPNSSPQQASRSATTGAMLSTPRDSYTSAANKQAGRNLTKLTNTLLGSTTTEKPIAS